MLTMLLYWIRPYDFICFDGNNVKILSDDSMFSSELLKKFKYVYKKKDAECYLKYCFSLKKELSTNEYPFKNIPELSSYAYNPKEITEHNNEKNIFINFLNEKKLVFDIELLENYFLSLKVKPFVIFTGNSGTGKSKLAKEFAEYLNCPYEMIAVGSNWTDNRNIVGYYNPITDDYMKTPSYNLIKEADISEKPSFLILDEMNLSRVEYYFSDILSSIESGKKINLNTDDVENKNIPKYLSLSENLYIVGTVNIDETTHMFSPKVLDRANTIEFNTINPVEYLENSEEMVFKGNVDYLLNPIEGRNVRKKSPSDIKTEINHVHIENDVLLWNKLVELLNELYIKLKESHFDFGFRVINEIIRFMYVSWCYENHPDNFTNWYRYFDAQIKQKILPRLHGSQNDLDKTLKDLIVICDDNDFTTSKEKLGEMIKVLESQKFVSFIN